MLLPANDDEDLDHVRVRGGDLLLGRVAVEDGRQLVPQDEGHGEDALRVAAQPGQRLARARGLARCGRAPAWRELLDDAEDRVGGERDVDLLDRLGRLRRRARTSRSRSGP